MNLKKGIKNIFWSIVSQAIAMLLGIVIPRLVIVSYGSEINGLLSSVTQVMGYLALLEAGVGTVSLQALYKPIVEENHDSINSILSATNHYYKKTGIIYLLFIVALSVVYPLLVNSTLSYGFMAIMVLICGIPNVINYLFQGKLKILIEAVGNNYVLINLNIVTSTLASVLKIILLVFNVNILLVQSIYCFISLTQMIFIYLYVKKKFPWLNLKAKPDYKALSQKNSALIHQICGVITNSTDVMLISIFCDLKAASIYAVYNMIFNLVFNILQSVNGGVQYLLGQTFQKDKQKYLKLINIYDIYYIGTCGALMMTAYVMILPFLKLYTAGADINYIDPVLPMLFVAVHMLRAMRNSSVNTISVAGQFERTRNFAIVESVINLTVSIIAVNFWGLSGVLIGTIAAFLYRNIVSIHFSNHYILNRSDWRSIKVCVSNMLLMLGLGVLFPFVPYQISGYGNFIVSAALTVVFCFFSFITMNSVLNPKCFMDGLRYLKDTRMKRKQQGRG